jgi:hypothetical protein
MYMVFRKLCGIGREKMGKVFGEAWDGYDTSADDDDVIEWIEPSKKSKNLNSVEVDQAHYDKILKNFNKKFPDEDACKNYLFNWRWPKGFRCPKCNHKKYYSYKKKQLDKYHEYFECKECRYQVSLTARTIFNRTRTPLHNWFFLIFCLNRTNKVKLTVIQRNWREGGKRKRKSYPAIWKMAQKIKKAKRKLDTKDMIAGIGPIKSVKKKELKKKRASSVHLKKKKRIKK